MSDFQYYGTISHGTLRTEDLIAAFFPVVETLCGLQPQIENEIAETDPDDFEKQDEILDCLFEILEEAAPDGYYFGAHPGDGSDFGYWANEDC